MARTALVGATGCRPTHPVPVFVRLAGASVLLGTGPLGCAVESGFDRIQSAPTVEIRSPVAGFAVRQGTGPVTIEGIVSDGYDAPQDMTLEWEPRDFAAQPLEADAEGVVTWTLDPDAFDVGELNYQLRATDSDADVGRADSWIKILAPLTAPQVTITDPDDGASFSLGETVTFQGEATDEGTDLDDLVYGWNSSLDGPLDGAVSADGRSIVVASSLSEGAHTITLQVEDPDGELGLDTIDITVGKGSTDDPIENAEPGDLVFSEMMINPEIVADEEGEWVELYNTSDYAIDISGYYFRDDDIDSWVLQGVIIPAHSYGVLCANLDPAENGGVDCDGWFQRDWEGGGMALANKDDEVVLTRPDGVEIDWLYYTSSWFTAAKATGVDPSMLTDDDNDNGANWCDQRTVMTSGGEPGTPGIENDLCD